MTLRRLFNRSIFPCLPSCHHVFALFTILVVLTSQAALAPHALAFERELPHAPAEKLVARASLNAVDYTQRLGSAVVAQPSVETVVAVWPSERRLARVPVESSRQPTDGDTLLVLEGEASYYSREGCLGCSPALRMANGQPLDDGALTMAIGADKMHLVGRLAKVTNLSSGQSVTVRITDTGGFFQARYGHRVADLTVATKQAIGMRGGLGHVRVEVY